ncbi:MAG: S8 family serine peptidase [Deltaproteobacteria bacterium]|nr:S8 family serine peptidase [Deltaproteobacteria bacterium]
MRIRLLAVALAVALGSVPALAQTAQEQENLRNLLNKKFGSQTRGVTRQQQDDKIKPDDYYYVKPDGSVQRAPNAPPQKRSETWGSIASGAWEWMVSFFTAPKPKGHDGTTATAGASRGPRQDDAATVPADDQKVMQFAQAGTNDPVAVKRNSYVIQLKPDVTSAQIDALLEKYDLEVTKYDDELGWLYVSQKSSGTRSAAPERDPATLDQLLRPRIVRDLRREPGVDAAFVNSGMKPNAMPAPVKTESESNGVMFRWYWRTGASDDGNWGLKSMRMPPVWSILQRYRKLNTSAAPVRVAVFDTGFANHSDLAYSKVVGNMSPPLIATCKYSHGTHVAGIIGASFGNKIGTDGIVPNSAVIAVPIGQDEPPPVDAASPEDAVQPDALFANVVQDTAVFLGANLSNEQQRAVVNFSLGYNWFVTGALKDEMPFENEGLREHIESQGTGARRLAHKFRSKVLFVQAAGNDSAWLEQQPLDARWASPFGWAGILGVGNTQPSDNILVVEATGRDGERAVFSNVGGHVAAPGVDIMSTLASRRESYGLCSGTSQAAPHVAALAAILFELAPEKTPAEIANVIRATASPHLRPPQPAPAPVQEATAPAPKAPAETSGPAPSEYDVGPPPPLGASTDPAPSGAAPAAGGPQRVDAKQVDALDAVLSLSPQMIEYLADLTGDGKVDSADLEVFRDNMTEIQEVKAGGPAFKTDLNGDGDIDGDENCWPLIDLNGSGKASYDVKQDGLAVLGKPMSDLDVVATAWTDKDKDFKTAMKDTGFADRIAQWESASVALVAGGNATATRPKIPCD